MEYEESLKKIAKGAGIIIIGIFLSKILTFFYRIILARMGASDYGLFSLGLAILGMISTIALLGFNTGIVRYVSYYKGKRDMERVKGTIYFILKIMTITILLSMIILLIFPETISVNFFHNKDLAPILRIMAFAIPPAVLSAIFLSLLRAHHNTKDWVYSKLIFENLSKIIITIILLLLGFKIFGVVIAYILSVFGTLLFSFYFVKKKIFSELKNVTSVSPPARELLNYSIPLLFNEIMVLILLWTDTFMIAYFLDVKLTGIYNVVIPIASLMHLFPYALMYLFLPVLTEVHSQDKRSIFKTLYRTITKWIFTVNLIIFSLFILISREFINIFFGSEYTADIFIIFNKEIPISVIALIILSTGFLVNYTTACSKNILIIYKKTKWIAFNMIATAIINILLNFYLIPILGIIGAAIATSVSFMIRSIINTIQAFIITKIQIFRFNFVKVFFSAILSLIIIFVLKNFFKSPEIISLILFSFAFVALYISFLFILRTFEEEDIYILRALRKKLSYMLRKGL
ncbi:MAG TPA: flippase [Candidatus Nanoarchaeia archaeon]|nr:flippase [Candidatus Nanoarchaeia archaeon]